MFTFSYQYAGEEIFSKLAKESAPLTRMHILLKSHYQSLTSYFKLSERVDYNKRNLYPKIKIILGWTHVVLRLMHC